MTNDNLYALVTGASTGIGRAIAKELASRKYNLILNSLPGQGLSLLCGEIEKDYGVKVICHEVDLTTETGPLSLFEFVSKSQISISVLVNNAGIGFEGPIEEYFTADIDTMIFLNIRALTLLTHYFTPGLKKCRKSYILFLSSFGCYLPTAYRSIYLATKSYIYYFARALESEFAGSPIRTCVMVPSAVSTNRFTLDRIRRGGWISQKSALSPEEVALTGIRGMFRGKKVIMPGVLTNIYFALGSFVPVGIAVMITRKIFRNYK
jgi:short-subunit dehydrogenase